MRIALRLLALSCFALLSACGFAPLYAQSGLTMSLSQIAVDVPQTRTGYFLEQDLTNSLATQSDAKKLYGLKIAMEENHYSIGYRVDDTSTRSELTNSVTYTLTDLQTGKVMTQGAFTDTVTYDTSTSPFTGIVSQQDAQKRVAASAAQKLQTALALYFHDAPKAQ
ncbi:MAG TPA: LPS assembly lipoprotein LptE [Asticcacaulis sp.]|nr:LPS assembly lipoprotein LptE [Asticcacaulis sp.]